MSRTTSSFNSLSFTLACLPHPSYMSVFHPCLPHPSSLYGLSLTVKVCILAACSPPESACLYWISCYAQDKMAYHPHSILYTSDAVTPCTPVTLFFPLGVRLCSKKRTKKGNSSKLNTLSCSRHLAKACCVSTFNSQLLDL